MSLSSWDANRKYTYHDYLQWQNNERYELIDGIPYLMSPSPSVKHQRISRELLTELALFLRNKECEVFDAPFDVRLFAENKADEEVIHVVQPDLVLVCDKSKLDDKGCNGSPDIIIEVISPSTAKYDRWIKFKLYEQARVKQYWIVEPEYETIEVFQLDIDRYRLQGVYGKGDPLPVSIFEDFSIDLKTIFPDEK